MVTFLFRLNLNKDFRHKKDLKYLYTEGLIFDITKQRKNISTKFQILNVLDN